ncbi:MAG TPA: ABC transporter ATP-binding protein [Candidatus Binatia bacterium]|jgi:ATP-binding cassette, subfamily B, multidrug efflux pump|nr:ABC transporter ATP-binding protein [Candidatus Binatia bacterium]
MGRLKTYVWRYWRRYLVGALCLFATATLVMWIPWWIREAVRIIESGGSLRDVTFYAAVIAAAAVVQGLTRTCSRALIFNAGRDVEYDLRNDLFAHLEKLPLSFYHSQRTGDLMSRVVNDISAVRMMLGPGILNFVNAPLYLVYALVLMLSMDVRMTLAALVPFPLLILAVAKFRGRILKSSLEVQQQMSNLSSHVQENLSGIHVVKAYTREEFQTRQFIALNDDFQTKSLELARMRGIITPIMQGFNALTVLIVIWYGGIRVIEGDLLVADIVAFVAYLNVLAWPTAAFGWMVSLVERGRAAMKRLEEILKTVPEIASPEEPLPLRPMKKGIEFRDVSFAYGRQSNGHGALEDINFSLPVGRSVGIVGRIGSGKSTVAQLVPRLLDASSGAILMDGQDIRKVSLRDLRKTLGYVPQDPFLFSMSLRRNLAFGRDNVSDEALRRAVKIAKLDRDLEIFPQGLETIVGERGVTLSGGQKQRATLARALVIDPPVLILDDCLSSVDAQTEAEILHQLRSILKEKTCLIISHRISAVKEADEILVLDEGKIIERGTHEELIDRGGVYADLYRQQQLSEELEQI